MKLKDALIKLIAGEKIRTSYWPPNAYIVFKDDKLVDENDKPFKGDIYFDNHLEFWEIYKKLEWYNLKENFPVICKVWDNNEHDASYALVISYTDSDDIFKFNTIDKKIWKNAVRVSTNGNPL